MVIGLQLMCESHADCIYRSGIKGSFAGYSANSIGSEESSHIFTVLSWS
jgi:hypothetical protein